jgi:hypothetical protein
MTTMLMHTDDTLIVVRDQSDALIRAEVRGMEARAQLERACREAVTLLGCSVDEVSAASGLTPAEIHRIVSKPLATDDLSALDGTC